MKKYSKITLILLILILIVISGCNGGSTPLTSEPSAEPPIEIVPTETVSPTSETNPDWWKTAVFYEIFVRSFNDSDGDGVGDFNGITMMLDYLNDGDPSTKTDLGITGIWLMPIFPSPSYHGYDVTDYKAVNPQYGTIEDFQNLLTEAHKRGIRIIIDFVINHTSSQHPWFQSAVDIDSPYRDYYVWSDSNPGYVGPWGQTVWIPSRNGYYYALFWDQMPDLNFRNSKVTEEIFDATRFWLEDVGVDGFRVDAARHLIEDGEVQANTPETHEWFTNWFTYYKAINPGAMSVGEVWDSTANVAKYLRGNELDLAFNFDMASSWISEISGGTTNVINFINKYEFERTKDVIFATFLTNHDMNRVMNQLNGDVDKAKLAAGLMLTYPGVPFIYYGEEIGMSGTKPDEDIRRPMQWSGDKNSGFTSGIPWRAPYKDYPTLNVVAQDSDPNSLLNYYRRLIHLRNNNSALLSGGMLPVDVSNTGVVAYIREDDDQTFLILANLSNQGVSNVNLTLESSKMTGVLLPEVILGQGTASSLTVDENGGFTGYVPFTQISAKTILIIKLR